jgi:large subunit ribosomal protein L5
MEKKAKKLNYRDALEKIVISVGVGKMRNVAHFDDKILPEIVKELSQISGQKAAVRKAKKAISNFKTRAGDIVGLQITLRGARMEDFFERMNTLVFPRVKDFRGVDPKNVDGHGHLNVGFKEQYVFPEIIVEQSNVSFGVQVTCVTKLGSRDEAIDFYREAGVPLKK